MRRLYQDKNLQLIFAITLMAVMGVSSIVPALPDVMEGLDFTPATIGLVVSVFTLPGVILAPVVGVLADRVGRKVVLVPSLFIFGGFGFACFFAQDMTQLLVLRFFQGVGAGPLGVLYGIIIGDLYEGRERAQAMGYNSSVLSMGVAGFPTIGGLLALIAWNWPFILPLTAIPLGLAVSTSLETPEPKNTGSLKEYLSAALAQMRTRQALGLFAVTWLTFVILYGPLVTYLPLLLDGRYALSPAGIGMVYMVTAGSSGLTAFQLGWLSEKFGGRTLLAASPMFYAIALLLMPNAPSVWHIIPPAICFGLGEGLGIPMTMTMLTNIAPMEQRGAFMAANGFLLRLSQTTAPIFMGLIYALFGMNAVFYAGILCAIAIFAIITTFLKETA